MRNDIAVVGGNPFTPMLEKQFKQGIKKLLNEQSSFKDWGGETNDLLTTRVTIGGKRVATAFAFKGIGKAGLLTPSKMGKNGDQLLRLFQSPADLFVVQYWGEIAQSVTEHVQAFARAQSVMTQKLVRFSALLMGVNPQGSSRRIRKPFRRLPASRRTNTLGSRPPIAHEPNLVGPLPAFLARDTSLHRRE